MARYKFYIVLYIFDIEHVLDHVCFSISTLHSVGSVIICNEEMKCLHFHLPTMVSKVNVDLYSASTQMPLTRSDMDHTV